MNILDRLDALEKMESRLRTLEATLGIENKYTAPKIVKPAPHPCQTRKRNA